MGWFGTKKPRFKDPVCGMNVEPEAAAGKDAFEGETFYFCSQHCLETFQADPRRFAQG